MVVKNVGYLKKDTVTSMFQDGIHFAIYKTRKNTAVLVTNNSTSIMYFPYQLNLYRCKQDRLPYKIVEGDNITSGIKIFDSLNDAITDIDYTLWNAGKQIISYNEFSINV